MFSATLVTKVPSPTRDNKRPIILEAAAKFFADHGYAAASMRKIATAAGVQAGSMYYYFPSKEDLLVAVHEEGIKRISVAVRQSLEGKSTPWDRLEAAMICHLETLLGGGDFARVVIMVPPNEDRFSYQRLIEHRDAYERIFVDLVKALNLKPDIAEGHFRLMIIGAMNWSPTWYREGGGTPEEIAVSFVRALKNGQSE